MRVLHFFKTYWPDTFGGVERTIHAIAKGTAPLGVQTDVLSLSREPDLNTVLFEGHWAHKAKLNLEVASTGFSLEAFGRFRALAAEADIVHYHFPWPFMDLVHFASRLGKPTLVTYHSDIVKQKGLLTLYRPLMRAFLGSVDRIVPTSPNYLQSSLDLSDFRDKCTVIPIGLDRASCPPASEAKKAEWRRKLPKTFFLFVGVLRYYKGLHILIDAAKRTGLPVAIVGAGPMEAELKQQAERLGAGNVFFLGALDDEDKSALLELSYATVFPSHLRSEAFGLSLVEASMFAKPMITCEVGSGTSYVNLDGTTGIVTAPNDAGALAEAMTRLAGDPAQAAAFGQAALARYEALFTIDRMCAAYVDLYGELLSRTRRK